MEAPKNDIIKQTPRRVLLLALITTVPLLLLSLLLSWSVVQVLVGFWVGALINLINFYLIARSAEKMLQGTQASSAMAASGGFLLRMAIYALGLFLVSRLGLQALLASAVGISMVGIVLKFGGLWSSRSNKEQ